MKKLIWTALFSTILSSNAFGFQIPKFTESGDNTPPLRHAKVRAQAFKHYRVQTEDGTYQLRSERICDTQGEAPVFEPRPDSSISINDLRPIKCETNLKNGSATLTMSGVIQLLRDVDMGGSRGDFKLFANASSVIMKDGTEYKSLPITYAAVDGLDQRMAIISNYGSNLTSDKAGDRILDEQISITFKFEDQ